MKKVWKILIIIAVILFVVVVGALLVTNTPNVSARIKVNGMFRALKTGDRTKIQKYLKKDEDTLSKDLLVSDSKDEKENQELLKILFGKLDYKVISSESTPDGVTLKLSVTNKDIGTVIEYYFFEGLSDSLSDNSDSNDSDDNSKLKQSLAEQYNSDKVELKTNELTLKFNKVDGEWQIDYDTNELTNAIFPGM